MIGCMGAVHISGRSASPLVIIGKASFSVGGQNLAATPGLLPLASMRYHPYKGRYTAFKPWRQNGGLLLEMVRRW